MEEITKTELTGCAQLISQLRSEAAKRVVGQQAVIDGILTALFAGGHVLLEGVSGLAKTLAVKTVADIAGLEFKRIQFTPDLLPADVTGTLIYEQSTGKFSVRKGPVFANIVLADEINRAPAKVQSALLEAMAEKQVTIGEKTYALPKPFLVLATQNPIELQGTFPLPEAQLDRFMLNIKMEYPSFEEEVNIVKGTTVDSTQQVNEVLSAQQILDFQSVIRRMPVPDNVCQYAVRLSSSTRPGQADAQLATKYLSWGAGPRASQYLVMGAKTHAAMQGKYSPDIEDVQAVAVEVLRHRIVRNYYAEAENISTEEIVSQLIKS